MKITRRCLPVLLLCTAALGTSTSPAAIGDANWISMGSTPSVAGTVYATAVDSMGNLFIGGSFTNAGGTPANGVAMWDGSKWSPLGSGIAQGAIYALAVSGSNVYAGGIFTNAGGVAANNVAKWDGQNWSGLGSGIQTSRGVLALAASRDAVYVGGYFYSQYNASSIAKWNGTDWTTLGPATTGAGAGVFAGLSPGTVYGLTLSGGDLYVAGDFYAVGDYGNKTIAPGVAKWDGSSWSALGSGITGGTYNPGVYALAISGANLYAGGSFTTAGGNTVTNVARWDGSSWASMGSLVTCGLSVEPVRSLAILGTNVYAGGRMCGIFKWQGHTWTNIATIPDAFDYVLTLTASSNSFFAGGGFKSVGGCVATNLVKSDGTNFAAVCSGMNDSVMALVGSGTNLFAGGLFTSAGGNSANHIARWDGAGWSALGAGVDGPVYALALSGTDLYAGGSFTNAGGNPANRTAKWNGNNWSALGAGMAGDGPIFLLPPCVYALATSGNAVYAGGYFTNAGGSTAKYIAKWDGTNWTALGSGMNDRVYALAVLGNDLYAGGWFVTAGEVTAPRIAKWDGSAWSQVGTGSYVFNNVYALAASGAVLYVGCEPWISWPERVAVKWDGITFSPLTLGMNGTVRALAVSGTDLFVGGDFTAVTNNAGLAVPVNYIAKWDGNDWSPAGSAVDKPVSALAVRGSELYAAGKFSMAGGKTSFRMARAVAIPGNWLTLHPGSSGANAYTLSYVGVPNTPYLVQSATDLTLVSWFTLATNTTDPNGRGTLQIACPTDSPRFHRIRSP